MNERRELSRRKLLQIASVAAGAAATRGFGSVENLFAQQS
jgi:hypothetical protein